MVYSNNMLANDHVVIKIKIVPADSFGEFVFLVKVVYFVFINLLVL